jgi:AMMECR1 domain-containing protein
MLASVAVASVRDLPQITAARAEAQAPPTAFGVFVTITRRRAGRREVHGCIGSYKTNGDSMPASDVVAKTMDAARSAAFDDERGARFEGPLRRDPSARVSTSVMKLPLVPLAFQDGRGGAGGEEAFDNGRTGVLVVGADGSTATFLPKVFPSSRPWTDIRTDLLAKANLSAGRSGKAVLSLYSYETLEVKAPLSRPYAGAYGDAVVSRYAAFVSGAGAFRNGLPPFRVSKEGVVGYDASEQIRNGAVCATLAKLTLPGNVARDVSAYLGALAAANPATTTLQAVAVAGVLPRERCAAGSRARSRISSFPSCSTRITRRAATALAGSRARRARSSRSRRRTRGKSGPWSRASRPRPVRTIFFSSITPSKWLSRDRGRAPACARHWRS